MKGPLLILLGLLCLQAVLGAYCHGKPDKYNVNEQPIWGGKSTLLKRHQYGELHQIGTGTT